MNRLTTYAIILVGMVTCSACFAAGSAASSPAASQAGNELLGAWKISGDKLTFLVFEPARCMVYEYGQLSVMKVARYEKGKVIAVSLGNPVTIQAQVKDGRLYTALEGKFEIFDRLAETPKEVDIGPMKLPAAGVVPADKMASIRKELDARFVKDQSVRKMPEGKAQEAARIVADNTAYLKSLVQEFGWIDTARFGAAAAQAAVVLMQHSGDLPLMRAAMPEVEKDIKARLAAKATATAAATALDAQSFAMLYDRVQLMLGANQRYGTQVGKNDKGQAVVMPLEDKARCDEFRKELGLMPLAEYLEIVKKQTGAKEVVMPQ